jgi:hypothetical protein
MARDTERMRVSINSEAPKIKIYVTKPAEQEIVAIIAGLRQKFKYSLSIFELYCKLPDNKVRRNEYQEIPLQVFNEIF